MQPTIQTPRLLLRNWTDEDIEALIPISADPIVMEHFPYTSTAEQTRVFGLRMRDLYAERGFCYFAVEEKETEEM
ncbi:MAG: GNAT family N-acetyltransferase, partial [Saprospiraceae bacterium]